MFTIAHPFPQNLFPIPQTPSPISPRHVNLPSRSRSMSQEQSHGPAPKNLNQSHFTPSPSTLGSQLPFQSSPSSPSSPSPSYYAQRYAKTTSKPASRVTERASNEYRRNAFLNRVKRDRKGGLFDARGEQIQRMDYLAQRREFEEEMARSAPQVDYLEEGSDSEMNGLDNNGELDSRQREEYDEALLEDFLSQEKEYQTFIEEMERQQSNSNHTNHSRSVEYENDDDSLFVDILSQVESEMHESMDISG